MSCYIEISLSNDLTILRNMETSFSYAKIILRNMETSLSYAKTIYVETKSYLETLQTHNGMSEYHLRQL